MRTILDGKRRSCNGSGPQRPQTEGFPVLSGDTLKRRRIIRTAEVTIETEENIVSCSSQEQRSSLTWCSECRRQVAMVSAEQAAQIMGVRPRVLYSWVESRKVHFSETREGLLLVCPNSLTGLKADMDR